MNLNKIILLILSALLLSSCASNYVRITEFAADSSILPFVTPKVGGCAVEVEGDVNGIQIDYTGDKCVVSNK